MKLSQAFADKIKSYAIAELGLQAIQFTDAVGAPYYDAYKAWIKNNFHGEMSYLDRHVEKKRHPKQLLSVVKSIVCVAISYKTKDPHPLKPKKGSGVISNYAWGDDYHDILKKKLKTLLAYIQSLDSSIEGRVYVDTGPLLERSFAQQAGIGWIGKNTCIINQGLGSYLFLGEILLSAQLPQDEPELDHCGSCTRCLDACPTDAFTKAYELDARKCIAYLTIEKRGPFTEEEEKMVGDHLFGCDICQQVCPWNDKGIQFDFQSFRPRPESYYPDLEGLEKLTESDFQKIYTKSPLKRAKYEGFKRNLNAVKANSMI